MSFSLLLLLKLSMLAVLREGVNERT